jgi:DNA-directed RNA polymerase specialized sigma24 family protein
MRHKLENDYFAMTQQEIADIMGMSRPALGCIERRAYEKFRKELEKRGYKIEDLLEVLQ